MRRASGPPYPGCEHFGEQLRVTKFGHTMTRALYAYPNRSPKQRPKRSIAGEEWWESAKWVYRDEEYSQHSDAYLLVQRDRALRNFDLSMEYFKTLPVDEFELALNHVLINGRTFKPVTSLSDWNEVAGAYVMVFDNYKQFYIGQARDIRKRIKQHWSGRKSFDRLIFGTPYDSILPMDELRALDTTRIYAARSSNPYAVEERAEKAADQRFCLNRMAGGEVTPLTLMLTTMSPRSRVHGMTSVPMTHQDYKTAWDGVAALVRQERTGDDPGLVAELIDLDMTIYSVQREDGGTFFWSRRDAIAGALARGELSETDFAEFLRAMGETILWPDN